MKPLRHCDAVITLPGSKSYTHRALVLSALADGESVLVNPLRSDDTEYTAQSLVRFGISVIWGENCLRCLGQGGRLKTGDEEIFLGNSGTSMRFITALAAIKNRADLADGNSRMRQRPMADMLDALNTLGVGPTHKTGMAAPPWLWSRMGFRGESR